MFGSIALPAVFDPRPQPALYAPPQPALYAPPEPAFGAPLAWAALRAWGAPPAWVAPALPADGHAPAVGRERDPAVERRAARREARAQQRQRFGARVDVSCSDGVDERVKALALLRSRPAASGAARAQIPSWA